jgi:hypothetical protein
MFPKSSTSKERLHIWRELRQKQHNSLEDLLLDFSNIKLESRYLDYYTPKSWPTPFEIVSEGYFCQSGVTLILTATLIYKNFLSEHEILLPVISNNVSGNTGLVVLNNNQVYNFNQGEICSWDFVKEHSTIFQINKLKAKDISY